VMSLAVFMSLLQALAALGVLCGSLILLLTSVDRYTPARVRYPMIGLVLWSVWSLLLASDGRHDSPPGIAMTLLVAWVLLRYGRQVRGVLAGESWWPGRRSQALICDWRRGAAVARTSLLPWLAACVIGVAHRDRVIEGPYGARLYSPRGGLLWAVTHVECGRRELALPFVSWSGQRWCMYAGWRPSGAFGVHLGQVGGGGA